jgi:ATP adenylyltransferase
MSEFNENLWAPWRMEYIRTLEQEAKEEGGCFLCRYHETPANDRVNHVICRSELAFVVMNRFPYTNGHLMVAAKRHVGHPCKLTEAELVEITRLTYQSVALLEETFHPQGFNVGSNIGRCAGAGLPEHLHNHIVARWSGDTNYMSILSGVRVIPDGLDATYEQLTRTAVRMGMRKG